MSSVEPGTVLIAEPWITETVLPMKEKLKLEVCQANNGAGIEKVLDLQLT